MRNILQTHIEKCIETGSGRLFLGEYERGGVLFSFEIGILR